MSEDDSNSENAKKIGSPQNKDKEDELLKKAKIEALKKIASPYNQGLIDSINRMNEQRKQISELYGKDSSIGKISKILEEQRDQINKSNLPKIAEMMANYEAQNKEQLKHLNEIVKPLQTLKLQPLQPPQMIPDFSKHHLKINKIQKEDRKRRIKAEESMIEQSKHLATIISQNTLLSQAITQLINHTVEFETEKAKGAAEQMRLSKHALWAAVISAIISAIALIYAIFWQQAPKVIVEPPLVNVSAPEVNLEPIIKELRLLNMSRGDKHKNGTQRKNIKKVH